MFKDYFETGNNKLNNWDIVMLENKFMLNVKKKESSYRVN